MADPNDQIDPLVQPPQSPADLTPWANAAGVPQMVHALGSSLYNLADMPRQAIQASENYRATGDYNAQPMVDMVTSLAGGGMGAAEKGAAGVFAGRLAKTANLPMLSSAQMLEKLGSEPEEILRSTGWFKGPEGQWRFEIPDQAAKMASPTKMLSTGMPASRIHNAGATLSDRMAHPELYEAYPELKNIPVNNRFYTSYNPPSLGAKESFNFEPMYNRPGEDLLATLHEVQHAVQNRERFAPGGNTDSLLQFAKQAAPSSVDPEELAFEAYRRHAGEVEARNVEKRQSYSNQDRQELSPWATQEYPYNKQIVRKVKPMYQVDK